MSERCRCCNKSPWEFVSGWYTVDDIKRARPTTTIPPDVYSDAFAEWLTEQYRLAMSKGIQIGREWERWR